MKFYKLVGGLEMPQVCESPRADQGVCLAMVCRVISVLVADQEWMTSQRQ